MRILMLGDIVGGASVETLCRRLWGLRREMACDMVVANGENATGIMGISAEDAGRLLDAGVDVLTGGNHSLHNRSVYNLLDDSPCILRPANLQPSLPGRGFGVFETKIGQVGVVNLLGRCNLDFRPDNPFRVIDKVLKELDGLPVLLDFHAEATSEKLAMAYYLDGKISTQWGTHTHVQTADEQILPKGTGYLTDLGMTGPVHSVIGVKPEQSIANFRGELTSRYETAPGPCMLAGAVFTIDAKTGRCTAAERVALRD